MRYVAVLRSFPFCHKNEEDNTLKRPSLKDKHRFIKGKDKTWTRGPWTPSLDRVHGSGPLFYQYRKYPKHL